MAPLQDSCDAEDFAAAMLPHVAMGPLELFLDCANTIRCLKSGPDRSAGADNRSAHLWGPFFAAFEVGDYEVFKTKAHATLRDVEEGKTTHWERRANNEADKLAKLGARCHIVNEEDIWLLRAMRQIVFEAATWAGVANARFANRGLRDHGELQEPLTLVVVDEVGATLKGKLLGDAERAEEDSGQRLFLGHTLRRAEVCKPGHGRILFCSTCGAYAWKACRGLGRQCKGNNVKGLRTQWERLGRRQFPHTAYGEWRIQEPTPLEDSDFQELIERLGIDESAGKADGLSNKRTSTPVAPQMSRGELLQAYGIDVEQVPHMREWAKRLHADRARRRKNQDVGFEAEDVSEDDDGFVDDSTV